MTYSGPYFSTLGFDYTQDQFEKCLFNSDPFYVDPSKEWSYDAWFTNQVKALLWGRFQKSSMMSDEIIEEKIKSRRELSEIPFIFGLDTLYGISYRLKVNEVEVKIEIFKHKSS